MDTDKKRDLCPSVFICGYSAFLTVARASGQGVVAGQPEDLVESRERVDGVVARRAHDQIVVRAGRQAEPERIEDLRLGENCGVAGEFQVEAPRSREAVAAHDDAIARR